MSAVTIAGLARKGGVGVETIRYYQRRGLLKTPPREVSAGKGGGIRRYGEEDIRRLRFIRSAQAAGFSLEQIAESTKISVRSLAAIEQGEFQKLPGGIYNTSYIRQYARAIDYDESAILSYYHRAMGTTESPSSVDGVNGRGFVNGYRPASSILGS